MSNLKKTLSAPRFLMTAFILGILALSSLACTISGTTTEPIVNPTQAPQPTAEQVESSPTAEVQPESMPEPAVGSNIVGFWRTKEVTKQVIIFEFQEGGQAVRHYHLNNGQNKDVTGAYSLEGTILMINMDNPQQFTVQIEGERLTLTGLDGKIFTLQRVASLDDPGPTASTNIPQDIINRWQDSAVQEWLEFKSDETLTITSNEKTISGTYMITGNSLEIKLENQDASSTFTVEIDGNVLTLFAQDGSFTDYVR